MGNRADNFNRSDNASSLGTPSDSGGGYTVLTSTAGTAATFGITGNKAYQTTTDWFAWAVLEAGSADVECAVTMSGFDGNGPRSGPGVRVSDGDNGIYAYIRDSSNVVELFKFVAGSATQLGSSFSHTPVDGDIAKIVANGNQISVKLNGTTVIGPVTETFNQTVTKHGLFTIGSTALRWDDLTITDLGAGPTAPTLASPAVPGAGTTITATLSQSGCIPTSGTGGFTVSATGGAVTVSGWAISGTTLTLTLSRTIFAAEVVTYSYDRATTTDDISESTGAQFLANFSGVSVSNNSTQGGGSSGGGPLVDGGLVK